MACTGCGHATATLPTGDVPAGNVSALQVGDLKPVANAPIALGRDANGVYAMSAICTHSQCDMTVDGTIDRSGAFCSCHGSRFDANGNVEEGPARTALQHLGVSIDGSGEITVHAGQAVSPSTRLAA